MLKITESFARGVIRSSVSACNKLWLAEMKTPTCSPPCHSYIPLSSLHCLAFELTLVTAVHPSVPRSYLWRLPHVLCGAVFCLIVFLTWMHVKMCKTLTHHDRELEIEVYFAVGCTVSWRFRAICSGVHGVLNCHKSEYVGLCLSRVKLTVWFLHFTAQLGLNRIASGLYSDVWPNYGSSTMTSDSFSWFYSVSTDKFRDIFKRGHDYFF
jgi:hypothetical protein